jgi:hypothetical protein
MIPVAKSDAAQGGTAIPGCALAFLFSANSVLLCALCGKAFFFSSFPNFYFPFSIFR